MSPLQNKLSLREKREDKFRERSSPFIPFIPCTSFLHQGFYQNFVSSKFNKSLFQIQYCFNFNSILHTVCMFVQIFSVLLEDFKSTVTPYY